jgi:uncharacterized protein (DUF488 family)
MNKLYTIGYATHTLESFVDILKKHGIKAVADVRTKPYSSYNSIFNRETLTDYLKSHDIDYVFLGSECGARCDDPACYTDGKVDYNLISQSTHFQKGLTRIKKGLEKYSIALMCAEKDPIICHRMILVSNNLFNMGIEINHILSIDTIETHGESEKRLMELYMLDQPEMFLSEQEQAQHAYYVQFQKIAHSEDTD